MCVCMHVVYSVCVLARAPGYVRKGGGGVGEKIAHFCGLHYALNQPCT